MEEILPKLADGRLRTMGGELLRWKLTEGNADELFEHLIEAFKKLDDSENGEGCLQLTTGVNGSKIVVNIPNEVRVEIIEGDIVTICDDGSVYLGVHDMWGRFFEVSIRRKE